MSRKSEFVATITKPGYKPATVTVTHKTGGAGAAGVAGNVLVGNKGHKTIVADYRASFAKLRAIPTDVMLPAHEEQGNLLAKRQKQLRGDPNAFVDTTELARFVDASEAAFNKELARQQAAGPKR